MIGYPITYGDILEKGNGFTSETVLTEISDYWSNEENLSNFNKGFKFGLLVFSISNVILNSTTAFAADNKALPANNDADPTSSPGSPNRGSLANVPNSDRGTYNAATLGICGIAMKSGSYWIGFVCGIAMIIGVRMAVTPPNVP